jgi:hypothetical protein
MMLLPSSAGDGAAKTTWSRRYRGDICHGAMKMSSHAGNNASESC